MASRRYLTTKDLIDIVEDENFYEADIFITPPNDGADSEEDSEDEETPAANINHLSGRQLEAEAVGRIRNIQGGTVHLGDDEMNAAVEDNEWDAEDDIPLSQLVKENQKFPNDLERKCSSDSDNPEPLKKKQKNPDTYKRNVIKHAKVKGLQHANWRGNIILPRRTGPDCK
ncbi:unnamed protein product [Phaedon cochleariae]|uniref:Uncharacterized protein n=1 Tax=Phaedon cochleariae TaxID=80249 RepID=A0A9N9SM35_PHACE|nr:unnamed protein product [Phaedon cochleariae]